MTQIWFNNCLKNAFTNYPNLNDSTKRAYDDLENHLIVEAVKKGIKEGKGENIQPPSIKNVEWKKVKSETEKTEKAVKNTDICKKTYSGLQVEWLS